MSERENAATGLGDLEENIRRKFLEGFGILSVVFAKGEGGMLETSVIVNQAVDCDAAELCTVIALAVTKYLKDHCGIEERREGMTDGKGKTETIQ